MVAMHAQVSPAERAKLTHAEAALRQVWQEHPHPKRSALVEALTSALVFEARGDFDLALAMLDGDGDA